MIRSFDAWALRSLLTGGHLNGELSGVSGPFLRIATRLDALPDRNLGARASRPSAAPASSLRVSPSIALGGASQLRRSQARRSASGAIWAASVSSIGIAFFSRARIFDTEAGGHGGGRVIHISGLGGRPAASSAA